MRKILSRYVTVYIFCRPKFNLLIIKFTDRPKVSLLYCFSFVCSSRIEWFDANLPCLSIHLQVSELSLPVFEKKRKQNVKENVNVCAFLLHTISLFFLEAAIFSWASLCMASLFSPCEDLIFALNDETITFNFSLSFINLQWKYYILAQNYWQCK